MTTQAEVTSTPVERDLLPAHQKVVAGDRCPRCDTRLFMHYDEPRCSICGYHDYSHRPVRRLAGVLRQTVCYSGNHCYLVGRQIAIEIHRNLVTKRGLRRLVVLCPFDGCGYHMFTVAQSTKEYVCHNRHKVMLIFDEGAVVGWE